MAPPGAGARNPLDHRILPHLLHRLPSAFRIPHRFLRFVLPKELLEVSQIDGCRNDYFFFRIVLPLSKALIAVMVLFYAVGHWNSYMQPLLYLSDRSRYQLQLVLKNILISSQPDASLAGMTDRAEMYKQTEMLEHAWW